MLGLKLIHVSKRGSWCYQSMFLSRTFKEFVTILNCDAGKIWTFPENSGSVSPRAILTGLNSLQGSDKGDICAYDYMKLKSYFYIRKLIRLNICNELVATNRILGLSLAVHNWYLRVPTPRVRGYKPSISCCLHWNVLWLQHVNCLFHGCAYHNGDFSSINSETMVWFRDFMARKLWYESVLFISAESGACRHVGSATGTSHAPRAGRPGNSQRTVTVINPARVASGIDTDHVWKSTAYCSNKQSSWGAVCHVKISRLHLNFGFQDLVSV